MEDLDLYYRDCVIGGQGAFIVPVRERAQFADAIRTKIVREIAGDPEAHLVKPAQATSPGNVFREGKFGLGPVAELNRGCFASTD